MWLSIGVLDLYERVGEDGCGGDGGHRLRGEGGGDAGGVQGGAVRDAALSARTLPFLPSSRGVADVVQRPDLGLDFELQLLGFDFNVSTAWFMANVVF